MNKKIMIRVVVFIAVTIGTAFLINKLNNSKLNNISRELSEAELPLVYVEYSGNIINQLSGYGQTMSISLMRDNIVPMTEAHTVSLLIDDQSDYAESFSYELRRIEGDSLIEEGDLTDISVSQNYQKTDVTFRMDMQKNQEYMLVFIVHGVDGTAAKYYTRVVTLENGYTKEMLAFVSRFHKLTFSKEYDIAKGNEVSRLLKGTSEERGLAHASLYSNYDTVTWGDLNPFEITAIVPSITEVDDGYGVVHLAYVVESIQNAKEHFYNVDEYYSMNYNRNTREVELLAFDRYVENVFDQSMISKDRNSISLGVSTGSGIEYISSTDKKQLAFVKERQLWYYDYKTNSLVSVFNFQQNNYSDARLQNRNLDINLLKIDEEGRVYFVVYGYMTRGEHSGKNGISLYCFHPDNFSMEEKYFATTDLPFDVLKQEIGRFTYLDDKDTFSYLVGGVLYQVTLDTMQREILMYGIDSEQYLVSKDRAVVAFPDTDDVTKVKKLIVYDFADGNSFSVDAGGTANCLQALGFVGNDLIYGTTKEADIMIASDGGATLPFFELDIVARDGEVLKKYDKSDVYILSVSVQPDKIYLERANKVQNFYEMVDSDYISFKPDDEEREIVTKNTYNSDGLYVLDLVFPSDMYMPTSARYVMAKITGFVEEAEAHKSKPVENCYYVFKNDGFAGQYKTAGKAISNVLKEDSGIVVDSDGNTVYRMLEADSYNTVADSIREISCENPEESLMTCAYMCINYAKGDGTLEDILACDSWEQAFSEYTYGVGMNISGISLSTALYFLDRDIPFAACMEDGRYVLVISYNSTHIRYYDPYADEEVKIARRSFEQELSANGNTMFTYTSQ